jgi:type I restriction enzyme S subunit
MVWNEELKREIPEGLSVCDLNYYVFLNTETFNPKSEPSTLVEHYSIPAFDNNKLPIFEYSDEIGSNKYKVNFNNILVSKLNPRFQRVRKPYCLSDKAICSTEFMVYYVRNKEFINYCHSLFLSSHFQSYLVSKETGSTGSRKRVEPEISLRYKVVEFPYSILQKYGLIVEPYFKIRLC